MLNQHPSTPPLELVQQWCHEDGDEIKTSPRWFHSVCAKAAQWGADMELEACCKWLPKMPPWSANDLRKHRRPKPPSLKESALNALEHILRHSQTDHGANTIRRALEALDD